MNPRTPTDGDFELLPTAEPGYWAFRVARADSVMGPDSAIAAGTTYANCTGMSTRPRLDLWGGYVAAQTEPAGGGSIWQNFVRQLPTVASISEGIDSQLWGKTFTHKYLDLIASTRPDVGDAISTASTTQFLALIGGGNLTLEDGGNPSASLEVYVDDPARLPAGGTTDALTLTTAPNANSGCGRCGCVVSPRPPGTVISWLAAR